MKTYSNRQFPKKPIKWKGSEMAVFVNHATEQVEMEGEQVQMYTADLTISKGEELKDIMKACTRMIADKELNDAVIYNFEIDGTKAVNIEKEYVEEAPTSVFPALPDSGWLEQGVIYSYNNGAVKVRQAHERTIYSPEQTPALFTFYREITEGQLWIVGEEVEAGSTREYDGITYECIQSHVTQEDWTPDKTPALWQVYEEPGGEYEVFKQPTGVHDVYMKDDIVWYPDVDTTLYISTIDNNSWAPGVYGWIEYTP
jgi:hypothetical protein